MFNYFKKIIGNKEIKKEEVGHYFHNGSCSFGANDDFNIIDSKNIETIFYLNTYATNSMKLIIESLKGIKEYHLERFPEIDSTTRLKVVDFDSSYISLDVTIYSDIAIFKVPDENEGFYYSRKDLMNEKYDSTQNVQKSQKEKDLILEKERLIKFQNLITKIININPRCDILLQNEKQAVLYINSPKYNFTLELSCDNKGWLQLEYSVNNYENSTHFNIGSENILNFDNTDKAFEVVVNTIVNRNKLFSIEDSPFEIFEYKTNVNLLDLSPIFDTFHLSDAVIFGFNLSFEYGLRVELTKCYHDAEIDWEIIPENAFIGEDIKKFISDNWDLIWSNEILEIKSEKILNQKFKLNPEFDKFSLIKAHTTNQNHYTKVNIQGIEGQKKLKELIDKIINTNKKIKIVQQDELGGMLLELYSLQYKFTFKLKLDLLTGVLWFDYYVYDFSGEPLNMVSNHKVSNHFKLKNLKDVNQAYDSLVKTISKINNLLNVNYKPFENFDYKNSVRLINIYKIDYMWIELLFEYGIRVRFRPKLDIQDFDDPWNNPLDEIRYKYEVIPNNAMQFDVIDDLADHCVILMGDFDKRELNRVLRVNDGWEFELNPDFYNRN